jgi:predicted HAD superfamily Cof-like phosphohydrolase
MTNFEDVQAFHSKFGIQVPEKPQLLDDDTYNFRLGFLKEELQEFINAQYHGDLATAADSLIDLVYVAIGTADMMGIGQDCWQEMWDEVQRANMSKERSSGSDDDRSTRKHSLDIVKPVDFVPPDIEGVIKKYQEI